MEQEHRFEWYEHAAQGRVAARCSCGWRSEFVTSPDRASDMLDEHAEVAQEFAGERDARRDR